MATYRTTKCPYCGFILEDSTIYAKELIGPPLETCPSCKRQYKTGMKYWKDMDGGEKSWYILRSIGLFPMSIGFPIFLLTIIPGIILKMIFGVEFDNDFVVGYIIFIAIVLSIGYIFSIISSTKETENG